MSRLQPAKGKLLLKGARCVDPQAGLDVLADILITDGSIAAVDTAIDAPDAEILEVGGRVVVPGPVDLHVHLREPGQEYKETIESGTRAAAHGGWTGVGVMANTHPVVDDGAQVRSVLNKADATGLVRVYVYGALTRGLRGEQLAEMADMVAAGAVGFSDDGHGIQNPLMMRRALQYALVFDKVVLAHAEDEKLADGGVVNEGLVSTRLGLPGQPALAEELAVRRDIALARLTGARLHICHVSTAGAVAAIREAKAAGDVAVTAEATPHHLFLNEDALDVRYNTNLKMAPPLRSEADRVAVLEAFLDGTIDALASDHAPHAPQEKELEFELAQFGTVGLETALPLVLGELVAAERLSWSDFVQRVAVAPRRILGLEPVSLAAGSVADLTVFDPAAKTKVTKDWLVGKSKNSAFLGWGVRGLATEVIVGGQRVLKEGCVVV